MFKGWSEKNQKEFERKNQGLDFYFCFADLELCAIYDKNGQERKKFRIISDELSNKLWQIYSENKSGYIPPIKFIDFDGGNFPAISNFERWVLIDKETFKEEAKVLKGGTLFLSQNFSDNSNRNYLWLDTTASFVFREPFTFRENYLQQKSLQTSQTRSSALTQIQNTIKEGNIDFTTLSDAMFFLGENYIDARPSDCLHCHEPENLAPERMAKYYECHINKCLWRSDRINDFKDNQIALIKRIINKFNDYKKEAIEEVIEAAQEQGITETELNNTRPGWPDFLRKLTNREQIGDYFTNQLEVDIKNLVAAKKKPGEAKQRAEKEAKENAKKEQERLKRAQEERKKQAQKQEETRIKREQEQAEKEAIKAKKEFEKARKEEENFWFWKRLEEEAKQKEQENINQEKQRLEQEKAKATKEEEKVKLEEQQQELAQREQELKKEREEEDQNKSLGSNILKKFASIPNFNRQENLEALIEPVKNNPNFLQQLQAKQIPSLTALIVDKSPQEVIITVKRFEYDQEKEKEKKIKAYYHLNSQEDLTDEQINNYLYREAIGQITAPTENLNQESNKLTIALILGGVSLLILFSFIVIRTKLKRR